MPNDALSILAMRELASLMILTIVALPVRYTQLQDAGADWRQSVTRSVRWLVELAAGGRCA